MPSLLEHMRRWENRDPDTIRQREEQQRKEEQAKEAQFQALKDDTIRLTSELLQAEKAEIVAGRLDPSFVLPESAAGLRMSKQQAIEFNKKSSEEFVNSCPEYAAFKNRQSWETIRDYILAQGVMIATAEVFRIAFERCRDLGLLTENPQPEPAPAPEPLPNDSSEPVRAQRDIHKPCLTWRGSELSMYDIERLPANEYKAVVALHPELF